MQDFHCQCGQRVHFDNTQCLNCGRQLRFDPETVRMRSLSSAPDQTLVGSNGERFRECRNRLDYTACNWVLPADSRRRYCRACRLNHVVPHLERPTNVRHWRKLEAAKRHLIYTLLQLGLPVEGKGETDALPLAFAFLEDSRSNANVRETFVATGHARGLITLNLAEADDAYREKIRQQLGEHYRTLLGHFRHESGHYYYDRFVRGTDWEKSVTEVFGDPNRDYQQAMDAHYARGGLPDWSGAYISSYAASHPLEDWAETWAHYLHMKDTLETAAVFGVAGAETATDGSLEDLVQRWVRLTVALNALNRSMGLPDAYPFVFSRAVEVKLDLVHRVIRAASR